MRNLAFPDAISISADSMDYSECLKEVNINIDYYYIKIAVSQVNPNYAFFSGLSKVNNKMELNVVDYTQITGGGSITNMKNEYSLQVGNFAHECRADPTHGNDEIFLPYAYTYFEGSDYFAFVVSGEQNTGSSTGLCTGKYGYFYIYKSFMSGSQYTLIETLGDKSGIQAFYDTNNSIENEGVLPLPAFSGFTKVVDMIFTDILGTNQPYVVCLVFYEDT